LDPGGGAGILADARAIARAGAFGCAAIAVSTIQSTSGMRSASATPTRDLLAACREVLAHQDVAAIKIGALGSESNAKAVGDLLAIHRDIPAVIDTVMLPSRGRARLLEERAVALLRDRVLRRAALVTVNAPEAEVLASRRVTRLEEAREAAAHLLTLGPQAVLLKGGHLTGKDAIDLLAIGDEILTIRAPRLRLSAQVHGGGCTLASLIAGRLTTGDDIPAAVRWAKKVHHAALRDAVNVGGEMRVLQL
jgi:hydroxymethylpyrimidine/phosphomethylpyrimidine kinase